MDSKITEITAAQKENAMVDLSDISAVKGKYGEVYESAPSWMRMMSPKDVRSVFTSASRQLHPLNRYLKTAGKNMAASTTAFVMDNIVDEQGDVFKKECEKYPGLALGLGTKLLSAIGLGDNVNFRKL